jgi:hypothetical protein
MLISNYIYEKFGLNHSVNYYWTILILLWKLTNFDSSWYYENLIKFLIYNVFEASEKRSGY